MVLNASGELCSGPTRWESRSGKTQVAAERNCGVTTICREISGTYAPLLAEVPDLLQTPEYARAVLRAANTSLDDDEIDRRVTVRMERQKRLSAADPLALWAVLDESVLRRHVGGAEVMRAQLEHLADRAAQPTITVQVLPYTLGAYAAFGHSFTILTFPTPGGGEVVHMDQLHSGLYLERESDLRRYKLAMNRLRAAALDPERFRNMIINAAEDLR
jgi:hypothetical protein